MRTLVKSAIAVLFVLCVFCGYAEAVMTVQPGVRAGYYDDSGKFFLGVDLKTDLATITINPNFEWVFVDDGDLFTANLDGTMDVLSALPVVRPWIGAGFGLLYAKPEAFDSQTDAAINLLAGLDLGIPLNPYIMAKYIITENDTFVVGAGIRF